MTGKGHLNVGFALSITGYAMIGKLGYDLAYQIICAIGVIMGAKAPDYLEIWRKTSGGYAPIIKHRTITHWFALWGFLFYIFYMILSEDKTFNSYVKENLNIVFNLENIYLLTFYSFFLGYFLGGISHLIVDIPNKKPIPIFTPFDRFSLNIWKSGEFEKIIVIIFLIFSLNYAGIINIKDIFKYLGS